MLPAFLIVIAAALMLLWWHALDTAMRTLLMVKGLPFDARKARSTTVAIWMSVIVTCGILLWPKSEGKMLTANAVPPPAARYTPDSLWYGPDSASIAGLEAGTASLVRYGRELIANTAAYIGPQGSVGHFSNGMNCQNCHLDAGTRPWGNNYGAVWSRYPKFRERSGRSETVAERVNDCVERSLNGIDLDSTGHEMRAIVAYMEWLGTGVPKGGKPNGTGLTEMAFLDRAADTLRGGRIFNAKCMACHDANGQGKKNADGLTYQFPPLWGPNSYNTGAGLYRLSRFADYVKSNMPLGATWDKPQLTDEEAWDVAAYVNSRQRPTRDLSHDWPKITAKPVDHPFGPYADGFTEQQHKFGPFAEIKAAADIGKKQAQK